MFPLAKLRSEFNNVPFMKITLFYNFWLILSLCLPTRSVISAYLHPASWHSLSFLWHLGLYLQLKCQSSSSGLHVKLPALHLHLKDPQVLKANICDSELITVYLLLHKHIPILSTDPRLAGPISKYGTIIHLDEQLRNQKACLSPISLSKSNEGSSLSGPNLYSFRTEFHLLSMTSYADAYLSLQAFPPQINSIS